MYTKYQSVLCTLLLQGSCTFTRRHYSSWTSFMGHSSSQNFQMTLQPTCSLDLSKLSTWMWGNRGLMKFWQITLTDANMNRVETCYNTVCYVRRGLFAWNFSVAFKVLSVKWSTKLAPVEWISVSNYHLNDCIANMWCPYGKCFIYILINNFV